MSQNQIIGTENNDFLLDTILDDHILALDGDDEIEISLGNDFVDGGEGNDKLIINYSASQEDLNFYLNSYFNGFSNDGSVDINLPSTGNSNHLDFYSIESFAINSGSGNDNINLVGYNYENYSNDEVNAGAGDDTISAGLGKDTVDGGDGFDVLRLDFTQSQTQTGVTSFLTDGGSGKYLDGMNTVTFSNIEAVDIIGSQYDDVLVAVTGDSGSEPPMYPMDYMVDGQEGIDQLVVDYSHLSEDLEFMLDVYDDGYSYGDGSQSGSLEVNSYMSGYNSRIDFQSIESFAINSGSGNDNINLVGYNYENYSNDAVNAGSGNDTISAGLGKDTVDGGDGFDVLRLDFTQSQTQTGVTSFLTDTGSGKYLDGMNTVTFSNIEAVDIIGSQYDDVLVAVTGDSGSEPPMYPMNSMVDGKEGIDSLVADYSHLSEDLEFMLDVEDNGYSYGDGSQSGSLEVNSYMSGYHSHLNFQSIESFAINSGSGNDNINLVGYNYENYSYENYSNDAVNAGGGDDTISAGLGNDTIDGGDGFDVLRLDFTQSPTQTGVTSFLTDTGSGKYLDGMNTVTFSNIEAVEIIGSDYDDVLVAVTGDSGSEPPMYPMNSMVDGKEGIDSLVADYSHLSEDLEFMLDVEDNGYSYGDGSQSGSLEVNSYMSGYHSHLNFQSIESFAINSGSGNDNINLVGYNYENYSNDAVNAGGGDDTISAGLGNDTIDGGDGFDVLRLDFTQSPTQTGVTSFLTDTGSGKYLDGMNTVTFSNIEAVEIIGSQYDDVLVAFTGDNVSEPPMYPMNYMVDGQEGIDQLVVDYSHLSEDLMFMLNNYGGNGSIDVHSYMTNYNSHIDFNSIESFALNSGSGNDNIDLGYDNVSDDEVNAGAGDDTISAGLGNDTIDGGSGNDILDGGDNNDTYIFKQGYGIDIVSDFGGENDTIVFDAGITLDNLNWDINGNDLVFNLTDSPGDRLIIENYANLIDSIENIQVEGQMLSIEEILVPQTIQVDNSYENPIENIQLEEQQMPSMEGILAPKTIGEFGQVINFNHNSQTIQLDNSYEDPVVFALPLSRNGADPAVVRITDIQSDNFTVYLQEAKYKDGAHINESFSYLVLEAGTGELDNGALLEVGKVDTNLVTTQGWENIDFNADFENTPVILSQVQSNADNQFVRTRQHQASIDGFSLSMEEEEALKSSGHGQETVGWLAIDSGQGNWGELEYQAGHTAREVNHNQYNLDFTHDFTNTPSLFASLASFYGVDSAGLRYQNLSDTQVQIILEEDTSLDSEIAHTNEIVDFLAISGTGDLTAIAYEPVDMI